MGGYPAVVTRGDGTRALVVQDYAFGKYLGFLQVSSRRTFHLTCFIQGLLKLVSDWIQRLGNRTGPSQDN